MQILIGEEIIEYNVVFRKRKTQCIQIRPPGDVTVLSPIGKSEQEIHRAVQTKVKWIRKKLSEMSEIYSLKRERQYINGEPFYYMGREHCLRIEAREKYKRPRVDLEGDKLVVYTAKVKAEDIRYAIENWYRKKAFENISDRISYYQCYFIERPTQVIVKKQRKRWGSCTAKHKLLFNFKCVMLPLWVLDYIVVHEMCHMVHLNHSNEFWSLVEQILPDYKLRRKWLKNNGGALI